MIIKIFCWLKISAAVFCLLLTSCFYGQANKSAENAEIKATEQKAIADIGDLLKKQILLTNVAQFTGNRILEGASGFLIKHNGANFAVTARHLLGEAGGVEPEIKINDLGQALKRWEMMPRVPTATAKETVELTASGLDFSQSASDIVLLKVLTKNFEIETLTPNFELPAVGEPLFLIGCPYSETTCKQNSYPAKYAEFDETERALVCEFDSKVKLSGFSGAPLVNGRGEVVGILVSSATDGGKNYILATHIKEIEKIKF